MFSQSTDALIEACEYSIKEPLQPLLQRIGIPREKSCGGPLFRAVVDAIKGHAVQHSRTPTGFSVGPVIVLTQAFLRKLERELNRGTICNSGDVLFGSIQVSGFDSDENLSEFFDDEESHIDLRELLQ
ncbi:MAG: hypothetical protein GY832_24255 [Chloroflexi bacterium]|nr:hypothetical protein [Chloroflexota bacterium]